MSAMAEMEKEQFYCAVCKRPVTRRDIDRGAAVVRFGEVLCLEHFDELYPDECISHPGEKVTTQCDYCGRWACDNCFIEIDGKKVCRQCKPAVVGEFITGKEARPIMEKPPPFKQPDSETAKELYKHRYAWRKREGLDSSIDDSYGALILRIIFMIMTLAVIILILIVRGC